jgi:hypothetical protein
MITIKAKDFREGYFKLNDYLFFEDGHDWVRGQVTAHNFHVRAVFNTADCDLEMAEVNYTPSKWNQLNRVYLNNEELAKLCARLKHYQDKGGKHRYYIPDIGMNFNARNNASGACLMSFTVGYNQRDGWHCEVFTRASELTLRWFMDLIFIHVLIREIGKIIGFTTTDCMVYWHMVSTYQSITSIPLFVIMAGKEDWLREQSEIWPERPEGLSEWKWGTVRRYHKAFLGDGYQSFRVQRRPSEMYRIMNGEMEPKKSVKTKDLTILKGIDYENVVYEEGDED